MVHLMTSLIPKPLLRAPANLLTAAEVQAAQAAFREHEGLIRVKTPFYDALSALSSPEQAPEAKMAFQETADQLRYSLLGSAISDPARRLEMYQMLMAANFYGNAVGVGPNKSLGDPRARILETYNFDMRRDTIVKKKIFDSVFKQQTAEGDEMIASLLQVERRLFGKSRLAQLDHGRQSLFLGCPVSEIKAEKQLKDILALPPVVEKGNFELGYDDQDPDLKDPHKYRWKDAVVSCAEEEGPRVIDPAPFSKYKPDDLTFKLRVLKPAPKLTFWARVRANALQLWVLLFGAWAAFFMVDEEVISLIALIYLKYSSRKASQEEMEKAGDTSRVYIFKQWGKVGM